MSRIRKAMMGRYMILMIILLLALAGLMLSMSNYVEIQTSKQELETVLKRAHIVVQDQ